MKKFSIMSLDANKSNVKKEEVQESSCGKHRSLSFGVLKGVVQMVKTPILFHYKFIIKII
jgi:hypothetical protein